MKFLDLAKKRYSCRKYDSKELDDKLILQVIEAGRIAPSAANYQPWHFIVIRKKEILSQIFTTYQRDWIRTAPCIIVICGNHDQSWKRSDGKDHCDIDAAIAIDHMTLAASEIGLATCWVCNFDMEICSDILGLPGNLKPVALLPIGYAMDTSDSERHHKRKAVDEILSWDKY